MLLRVLSNSTLHFLARDITQPPINVQISPKWSKIVCAVKKTFLLLKLTWFSISSKQQPYILLSSTIMLKSPFLIITPKEKESLIVGKLFSCKVSLLTFSSLTSALFTVWQSWARDNSVATMWPCYQALKLFVIIILLYLLWLPHLDTEAYRVTIFRFFSGPWLVLEAIYVVALSLSRS